MYREYHSLNRYFERNYSVYFTIKLPTVKVSKFAINMRFLTTILIGFNYLCIYLKIKGILSLVSPIVLPTILIVFSA